MNNAKPRRTRRAGDPKASRARIGQAGTAERTDADARALDRWIEVFSSRGVSSWDDTLIALIDMRKSLLEQATMPKRSGPTVLRIDSKRTRPRS